MVRMYKKTSAHIPLLKALVLITIFPFILNLYKFIQNKIHAIHGNKNIAIALPNKSLLHQLIVYYQSILFQVIRKISCIMHLSVWKCHVNTDIDTVFKWNNGEEMPVWMTCKAMMCLTGLSSTSCYLQMPWLLTVT